MASGDVLEMFCVYDHPRDYPEEFVVRRWGVGAGPDVLLVDAEPCIRGRTLAEVRDRLAARAGLVRLDRSPEDDPVIVEVWF